MTATRLLPSHYTRQHTSEIELHISAGSLGDLLAEAGLLAAGSDAYEVTPAGRWFLRNLAMTLDAYLPGLVAASRPVFSRTV
jgi:coproporphyrinogen III oxidase-like Fe-S oxidoreductase